jgi:hypothetical protein
MNYNYKEYTSAGGLSTGLEEYGDTVFGAEKILDVLEAFGIKIQDKKRFLSEIMHVDFQLKIYYLREHHEAYHQFGQFMMRLEHENYKLR